MTAFFSAIPDYLELTKPRICLLALAMAVVGFFYGSPGHIEPFRLLVTLFGMALVGASAGTLNQYCEADLDAKMRRTLHRPLPEGRLLPRQALVFGAITGFVGEFTLLFFVNSITAVLGALIFFFYVGIYTPAKRVSHFSTLIGAIPGALPPMMGFTAAHGTIAPIGWIFFWILFLWQIPHFFAIAGMYAEDYARAKIPLLAAVDPVGGPKLCVLYAIALVPLSLVPCAWASAGRIYFLVATFMGALYVLMTFLWAIRPSKHWARMLFIVSIFYLPIIGFLLVWDRAT